ncbi:MAG: YebC/PmpR family DNA-binding transcriptional regulator [Candidatus Omnitrophota bacterium]
MSGHSKWASIKHKKAATDSKRGKLFTKLIREITSAAKSGGDPEKNPALRTAIQKAKDANMPQDNVDRAVKRGTGELPGVNYESVTYEGYGQGGVAIIIEALTDNKNRTSSEVRSIFSKKGGNMAGAGSVSWIFEKKGYFVIDKSAIGEDKLMGIVLDAGAEDMVAEDTTYAVKSLPADFDRVRSALESNNIKIESAEITMVPKSTIKLAGDDAKHVLSLVSALEDQDDVQNVYANFDIPDELMESAEE